MHKKPIEDEQGEEFICQECDESFFHLEKDEPVCPKCGKKGSEWLLQVSLQQDEDEQPINAGT